MVLVNFWTYSCINSLRELPYMKAWAAKYKDAGLVVIGVHTPEFGFEREPVNVKSAVYEFKIAYPIPIDSNRSIWRVFATNTGPQTTSPMQRDEFVSIVSGRATISSLSASFRRF